MQTESNKVKALPSQEGFGQIWMIDERELFTLLQCTGKATYGEKFLIRKEDYPVIRKLLIHFFADEELARKNEIDLSKGVLLSGPVGCGKTSLMNLVRSFIAIDQRHIMRSCRAVAFEFLSDGFETIMKYSKKSFFKSGLVVTPKSYCFDDLGQEMKMKYYGNECEVMKEIILSRYDLFESHRLITHFTTNLKSEELESRYGKNVMSRLVGMTNFFSFDDNTADKRRH